jgi:hypothetical protein
MGQVSLVTREPGQSLSMNHGQERAELRGAVYRGDSAYLLSLLKGEAGGANSP